MACEIILQTGKNHSARAEQDAGDRAVWTEDTFERFGGLREDSADAAKFRKQSACYPFAVGGFDRRQEMCQDGSLPLCRNRCWCRQVARMRSGGSSQDEATCIVR